MTRLFSIINVTRSRRLVKHVLEGTLGYRVNWEISKRKVQFQNWARRTKVSNKQKKWNLAKAKGQTLDICVEGGGVLRLNTDSALGRAIYCEDFELNERTFAWRYLQQGDLFVDIGANIGLYSVIAAKRVGERGQVIAFEPAKLARQRLKENIQLNNFSNVNIESFALSDREGTSDIHVPYDGYDAWSSMAMPIDGSDIRVETIVTTSWDTFARKIGDIVPTMMKIDVEGWECRVLDGASSMLVSGNAPLLQVEFTDEAATAAGSSCTDLYYSLQGFGYTICRYDKSLNQLIPDQLRSQYPYDNLFATKCLEKDNTRLENS